MNKLSNIIFILVAATILLQVNVAAQTLERTEVPEQYKWKLEDLYPSDQAWNQAKQKLAAQFDEIKKYEGKLAGSASKLLACLEFDSHISKEFGRLYSYASMKSDEDKSNSKYIAMEQEMQQLGTNYNSLSAFITPEIAGMDKKTIDKFIKQKSGLKIYKMKLYDIQRRKAHTLSEKEEKILAEAGLLSDGPYTIYGIFSNAE
ncbi:MAG: hypothetical protein PVH77_11545, partial [Phycisphaerales bacterium]